MMGTTAAALMWWFRIKGRQQGEAVAHQQHLQAHLQARRYTNALEVEVLLLSNPRIVIAPQSDPLAGTRDRAIIGHWINNDIPIIWRII